MNNSEREIWRTSKGYPFTLSRPFSITLELPQHISSAL